jgi:two-component system, sensor histidine kinase and response regulator
MLVCMDASAKVPTMDGEIPRSRILVIDDDPRNRALTRAFLRAHHDVVDAVSAAEGYQVLARERIDLVLLDVMMPEIDGFTACREIKRRFPEPFLPVLLLTALGDQDHRNLGFESGADDFLAKPVDRRELELRVRAFLRLRHQDDLIRRQLAELRRLDRLKDDLAALIVHDLRNPLAGLDGFLQLLERTSEGSRKEMVGWALLAAKNLRDTVEDMLKIRRLEESQLELQLRRISLRRLAESAAQSLRGDAEARELQVAISGDDVEVDGDETLLRRAVENLVANGLRYTRSGTSVDVLVHRDGDRAEIDVADRGPGVPAELKSELFQKYGSIEARAGQVRRGNGLGLYLVRLTAEAHGGVAAAFDRPGGGTVFRISLPVAGS